MTICTYILKSNEKLNLKSLSGSNTVAPTPSFPLLLTPHVVETKPHHHRVLLVVAGHRSLDHCLRLCRVDPGVQCFDLHSVIVSSFLHFKHIKVRIQCYVPNELAIIKVFKNGLFLWSSSKVRFEVSHISWVWSQEAFKIG